jgi:hypothetical protein
MANGGWMALLPSQQFWESQVAATNCEAIFSAMGRVEQHALARKDSYAIKVSWN